jgi:hypothetical protein
MAHTQLPSAKPSLKANLTNAGGSPESETETLSMRSVELSIRSADLTQQSENILKKSRSLREFLKVRVPIEGPRGNKTNR